MGFIRAYYIQEESLYNVYDIDTDNLLLTLIEDIIPQNDPLIISEIDGSFLGVYYEEGDRFIADYLYDLGTGWFWPGRELNWNENLRP